eukprot:578120-Pyramimonas_sp.AAC.2
MWLASVSRQKGSDCLLLVRRARCQATLISAGWTWALAYVGDLDAPHAPARGQRLVPCQTWGM